MMSAIKQIALTLYGQPIQGIAIPIGSTVLWTLDIENPITRQPTDITAVGTSVIMSMAKLDARGNPITPPLFAHEATILGSPTNRCTITWTSGDTAPSGVPITATDYGIDVWLEDAAGNRLQELATAIVSITAVATLPGAPVTPSPPEQPLGLGLQGPAGAAGAPGPPGTPGGNSDIQPVGTSDIGGTSGKYADAGHIHAHANQLGGALHAVATQGTPGFESAADKTKLDGLVGFPDPAAFVDGATPVVRVGAWVYNTRLTYDDIDAGFSITSFAGAGTYAAIKECGDSIINPSFTASYSGTLSAASLNDGAGAVALTLPATSFAYNGGASGLPARTYTKTAINDFVTWSLSVTELNGPIKSAAVSSSWLPRVYYGAHAAGTYNAAFIAALASSALAGSRVRSISTTTGAGEYVFYAYPTSYGGVPGDFVDTATGFAFGVSKVASAVSITNAFGVVISMDVWRSDFPNLGATTMQVS